MRKNKQTDTKKRICRVLDEFGELTQSEIAKKLGIANSTASYHLKDLEGRGMVIKGEFVTNWYLMRWMLES